MMPHTPTDVSLPNNPTTMLQLPSGSQRACFDLIITDDNIIENNESISLQLFSVTEEVLVNTSTTVVTIIDNDSFTPQLIVVPSVVSENNATIEVCVNSGGVELDRNVVVTLQTLSRSAEGVYVCVDNL